MFYPYASSGFRRKNAFSSFGEKMHFPVFAGKLCVFRFRQENVFFFAVLARKYFLWGFGGNMGFWVLAGKWIISVLAGKFVFSGFGRKVRLYWFDRKVCFYRNIHFTFFVKKHILRFWRKSVFFNFAEKCIFGSRGKMYLQKKKNLRFENNILTLKGHFLSFIILDWRCTIKTHLHLSNNLRWLFKNSAGWSIWM